MLRDDPDAASVATDMFENFSTLGDNEAQGEFETREIDTLFNKVYYPNTSPYQCDKRPTHSLARG